MSDIVVAPDGPPPGSGTTTLTERDRRLAARHEERRRKRSNGFQVGPAEKDLQEREQERLAFQHDVDASKRASYDGRPVVQRNPSPSSQKHSILQAVTPAVSAEDRNRGGGLGTALDQRAADRATREAIYEEKRRRYLAAKGQSSSSKPEHTAVRFQRQGRSEEVPSARQQQHSTGKTNTAETNTEVISDREGQVALDSHSTATMRPKQMRAPDSAIRETPANLRPSSARKTSNKSTKFRYSEGGVDPDTAAVATSATKLLPTSPRYVEEPKAEYARQLREQITANSAVTQRANTNACTQNSVVDSTTSGSAICTIPDNHRSTGFLSHMHDGAVRNREGGAAVNRKAEYGRQLREQMAEKASRLAVANSDRRTSHGTTATGSAREDAGRQGVLDNHKSKVEYTGQLREQISEARETRLAEGQRGRDEQFPSVDNSGLRWLVEADGRERRRRDAKAEYADQLRAQMEVQRRGGRNGPAQEVVGNRGPGHQHFPLKDQGKASVHAGGLDYLASERQKQVEHQRAYAEALRRDMSVPKIDSLGRLIPDFEGINRAPHEHTNNWSHYDSHNSIAYSSQRDEQERYIQHTGPKPERLSNGSSDGKNDHLYQHHQHHQQNPEEYPKLTPPNASHPLNHQGQQQPQQPQHQEQTLLPEWEQRQNAPRAFSAGARESLVTSTHRNGGRGSVHGEENGDLLRTVQQHRRRSPPGRWGEERPRHQRESDSWHKQENDGRTHPRRRSGYYEPGNYLGVTQKPHHGGDSVSEHPAPLLREPSSGGGGDGYRGNTPCDQRAASSATPGYDKHYWHSSMNSVSGLPHEQHKQQTVGATRASTMHNPIDVEELARIRSKKDAYRRDLEAQVTEHKQRVQRQKHGRPEPGSKEAEVFLLQQLMEERNNVNEMPPGYEMGPLGVPVVKDVQSGSRKDRKAAHDEATADTGYRESPSKVEGTVGISHGSGAAVVASSVQAGAGGAGAGFRGLGAGAGAIQQRRGQGLKNLLGADIAEGEKEKERSRHQAEALKKQVEDNKARRDSQRALIEAEESRDDARLQKEREQLHKRFEQEDKVAKTIENQRLLKEAEEARKMVTARKDAEAARLREEEIRDNARVERERVELERKYARERTMEQPLSRVAPASAATIPEFQEAKTTSPRRGEKSSTIATPNIARTNDQVRATARFDEKSVTNGGAGEHPYSLARGAKTSREVTSLFAAASTPSQSPVNRHHAGFENAIMMEGGALPHTSAKGGVWSQGVERMQRFVCDGTSVTSAPAPPAPQPSTQPPQTTESSFDHLKAELFRQKQLAEGLRKEVDQREEEKRQLLDLARTAKESEAALVRAAYERRARHQEELARNGRGAVGGKKLWRVPPPPDDVADGSGNEPCGPFKGRANEIYDRIDNSYENPSDWTVEDRLVLAGLRSKPSFSDEKAAIDSSRRSEEIGGDSTFRERSRGARAWSSQGLGNYNSTSDADREARRSLRYRDLSSPGGIRASSRYVFPDGSVRRQLLEVGSGDTIGGSENRGVANSNTGVPMPLIGTSRMKSADLSSDFGLKAVHPGGADDTSRPIHNDAGREDISGRRRALKRGGGAYRGPGAAPGASFAPGGRPPRAYVPFLNLPKLGITEGSRGWCGGSSWDHDREGAVASGNVGNTSHRRRRGRPLAGVGGVLVSAGRAMLTGPSRPGTDASLSCWSSCSSRACCEVDGKGRRRCHRRGHEHHGYGDGEISDEGNSIESGSTDVEFLRRRAESKLRSLERREAADAAPAFSSQLPSSHTRNVATSRERTRAAQRYQQQQSSGNSSNSSNSSRGNNDANCCNDVQGKKGRPGTRRSEDSMLGSSRWATIHKPITRLAVCRDGQG